MKHLKTYLLLLSVSFFVLGCTQESLSPEEEIRIQMETAQTGDIIRIPEGVFKFKRSLVMNSDGVTITGAGMDKTILSFSEQIAGAEGLSVNASEFTIEDLAIEDTIGDALKVNEGNNIVIRRVRTEWTRGPNVKNGAYGIYPVQTTNLLVEESVAIAASDAGIYVGQSDNIIVKNNRAEYNVAGIEIENSTNADVFDNLAKNNTGGILVFNMPQISKTGHSTRVFKNSIIENNTENFAAEGTAVSGVPKGSGILINSNDLVEVFDNEFNNNDTANIVISSYFSANYAGQRELAEEFDPYPEGIFIYDNKFVGGGSEPGRDYLLELKNAVFGENGEFPDVIWDGMTNPAKPDSKLICIQNGNAKILNIDLANEFAEPRIDEASHNCVLPKLTEVVLSES